LSLRKALVALALSAAVLGGTTGCSFSSQVETMKPYTPSDGFQADYTEHDLKVRNVLYITIGDQSTLIGSIINTGKNPASVSIRYADGVTGQVTEKDIATIAGGRKYDIGFNGAPNLDVTLQGVAGGLTEVQFLLDGAEIKDADGNVERLTIPVVDGTLAEYRALLEQTTE
jgi:hypothetical protein